VNEIDPQDARDDDASEAWQAPVFLAVAAAQMFALIFAVTPH